MLPWVINVGCGTKRAAGLRRPVCAGLCGHGGANCISSSKVLRAQAKGVGDDADR